MDEFIGKFISLKCGNTLGVVQGQIVHVDTVNQQITLSKAFRNGYPYPNDKIVVSANEIRDMEMIEAHSEVTQNSAVKIKKPVAKKAGNHSSETASSSRSLEQESPRKHHEEQKSASHADVMRTPSKKDRWKKGWKDEAAFGSPVDKCMNTEFDFESNLALFNKKAFYEEINASKPDVVRQTDKKNGKYRCDENVLNSKPAIYRQIMVPQPNRLEYATDSGIIVPSLTIELYRRLFEVAESMGLSFQRQCEMVGRAATEMVLLLLGGGHRLNPNNHHQCPSVVILCGSHRTGAQTVNCARQLATHGVRTTVYIQDPRTLTADMNNELALYRHTSNRVTTNIQDLCITPVDLIIMGLLDCDAKPRGPTTPIAKWAQDHRAQVLALNPPASGTPGVSANFSLIPGLPLCYEANNGKIYLCNIGIPQEVFSEVGIKYVPPFGPKFVLPLYPNDM